MQSLSCVALVSLEAWDDVWRRNQHLAARLVRRGHVDRVVFVDPPRRRPRAPFSPEPGVEVVTPPLLVPPRAGGLNMVGRWVRRRTRDADVLWVNDAQTGVRALARRQPVLYDVTDDWRQAATSPAALRRLVAAEDRLAERATTTVCSTELARRWRERYAVEARVVLNAVDVEAARSTPSHRPDGTGPHAAYIGTLHAERLDVEAVLRLAESGAVGTLHLVGPDALDEASRRRLSGSAKIRFVGPVAAGAVPAWMRGVDVLLCPHLVTPFTLSLDAIKAHEYLASGRPVVATPTSGFQHLRADGVWVTDDLEAGVRAALAGPPGYGSRGAVDWDVRADQFAQALHQAAGSA